MNAALIYGYLNINAFIAGVIFHQYSESDTDYRIILLAVVLLCCFGIPIFVLIYLIEYAIKLWDWAKNNTRIYYDWMWYTNHYDKMPKEELENLIARCRGKIKYAEANDLMKMRSWRQLKIAVDRIVKRYDPQNLIEPDIYR